MLQLVPTCCEMPPDAVRTLTILGSALALAAACHSASPLEKGQPDKKESPDVRVLEAGPADIPARRPSPCGGRNDTGIWRTTSKEITIRAFEYFTGGFRFRADCSLLSHEQIQLLGRLELVSADHRSPPCPSDYRQRSIDIVDEDGGVRSYHSASGDALCEEKGQRIVDDTISAFIATFACLAAGRSRWGDPSAPGRTMNTALPVLVDDGCEHGFFGGPAWVSVSMNKPGRYVFRGVDCSAQEARLTLYSANGKRLSTTGNKEEAPGCWMIEHQVEQPEKLFLRVDGNGGDYFVRFSSKEKSLSK